MYIEYVEGINFLSFEHLYYEFTPAGTLVQGVNMTNPDQENNGSGKTSFQAIVEYCIIGSTSHKTRDKKLIRTGEKEATSRMLIVDPLSDQKCLIDRTIKTRGPNAVKVEINGVVEELATVADANNFIKDWIGISKDDLQNYYIINEQRYKNFFKASNREKIEIIGRFSNADQTDSIFAVIENDINGLEEDLEKVKWKQAKHEGKIEVLEDNVQGLNLEKFNQRIDDKMSEYQAELDRVNIKIKKSKNDIGEADFRINDLNAQIEKLTSVKEKAKDELSEIDLHVHDQELQEHDTEINEQSSIIEKLRKFRKKREKDRGDLIEVLSRIKKNLMSSVQCPSCNTEFFPGDTNADVHAERLKEE